MPSVLRPHRETLPALFMLSALSLLHAQQVARHPLLYRHGGVLHEAAGRSWSVVGIAERLVGVVHGAEGAAGGIQAGTGVRVESAQIVRELKPNQVPVRHGVVAAHHIDPSHFLINMAGEEHSCRSNHWTETGAKDLTNC